PPFPDRARQLERRAGQEPDGPHHGGRRAGHDPGHGRPLDPRESPQRELRPPVPQCEDAASRVPARLRFSGGRRTRRLGSGGGAAGLRRGAQARPAHGGSVGLFVLRVRRVPPAAHQLRRARPRDRRRVGNPRAAHPLRLERQRAQAAQGHVGHSGGDAGGGRGQGRHVVRRRQSTGPHDPRDGDGPDGAALGQVLRPQTPSPYPRAPLRKLDRIGLQLYTVRHAMEKDVEGTIARVAAIGYREVEFAGYFGKSARDVRALLDKNGLSSPASHISLSPEQRRAALDAAPVIGHRYLVLAWIPAEERHTLDDYKRWAERLNRAGTEAKAAGLQFAYHNHDFEFAPLDGKLPYDVLLAETDPKLVQLEVDLYWITKGGQDPLAYFARWPGRFPMVHVKDSAGPPDHRIVEVGAGKIDFKKIFAQSDQAGIKYYFVEHDEPADAFASIRA